MKPYEIIGTPLVLYLAPEGTAFPALGEEPAEPWVKVGTNGAANYDDTGVTVEHGETIEVARPAGTTGAVKAWRTEENLTIGVTLWDLTLEQYAKALNDATVNTTAAAAGTPGTKAIGLSQGLEVRTHALLARGVSPYGPQWQAQYEVPRCYQSGNPNPAYRKGNPAGLALQFAALEDLEAASEAERFGRLIAQHQAAI